jgi:DNA polymerase III alpha subunit
MITISSRLRRGSIKAMRVRTGYSFKTAYGHLPAVLSRLQEIGSPVAPISDRLSTFAFVRWTKMCKTTGIRPLYGVEIGVVPSLGLNKPPVDYWSFFAKDDLSDLHRAIYKATWNPGKEPTLSADEAVKLPGLIKISGERLLLDSLPGEAYDARSDYFVGLAPSSPVGLVRRVRNAGLRFIATSDNYFPRDTDQDEYRIALGFRASTQSYPRYILSDDELRAHFLNVGFDDDLIADAFTNRNLAIDACRAQLKKAHLLVPEKPISLRKMCEDGAITKGLDLTDPTYEERLTRELQLISDKNFDDYFYILADIVNWAKTKMVVGPGRGSSGGSLVCYCLNITEIDPIKHDLLFERFIDANRFELPDIDVDFSDINRDLVFQYAEEKYGSQRVARLGTVGMFKGRSALKAAGAALRIPIWRTDKLMDHLIERTSGDSRANNTLEDTLKETAAGQALLNEYPEVLIAAKFEGHPVNASQHAAGVVLTEDPLIDFVAMDARSKSVMCDKKDAAELNLLKIDALGLKQLSIFERTLELIGEKPTNGFLEKIPLDDQASFDVLNNGHFAGIFQFAGIALRSVANQVTFTRFEDVAAMTALVRPGPLATGGTSRWVRRKRGEEPITQVHPLLLELTKDSYGVVLYQEQVLRIVREIGQFSWEDTGAIRHAMSGILGDEFFGKYWIKFRAGATSQGIEEDKAKEIWDQICTYASWSFNKCLDGETRLRLSIAGCNTQERTIAELYEKYEEAPSRWIKQQKSKPWLVSLFPDDRGRPQKAVRIIKSGKKLCKRYTFDDGSQVVCTPEHRFLISGEWKPIKEAGLGDEFTSVEFEPIPCYKPTGEGKGHGKGWTTGVAFYKDQFIERRQDDPCEDCGKFKVRMEAHHTDFNAGKDQPEDLVWLCNSCHKKRHYAHGRTKVWENGYKQAIKKLQRIEDAGIRETYDIEMPEQHNFALENGLITHNSHSIAYGLVSYYCCWLKAHYPLEFAAATLDAEAEPANQLAILRELDKEGITYTPVDPEASTERWSIAEKDGRQVLVGPITAIKGIGPKKVLEVLASRKDGRELKPALKRMLTEARTEIDDLYPIKAQIRRLHPDTSAPPLNIVTPILPIERVQPGVEGNVVILAMARRIKWRDENDAQKLAQRDGRKLNGPTQVLNTYFCDDTDEIFCKIGRFDYERIGRKMLDKARAGKSLYAIKGTVPPDFRMIKVSAIKYLGELDGQDELRSLEQSR